MHPHNAGPMKIQEHHQPHQYATETFCAFVFAVCVLVALLLLAG